MVDQTVRRLLEHVVDSPIKLQLLLLFAENSKMHGTAAEIAQRVYRDIWSVREALHELHRDGVLSGVNVSGETIYRYSPCPEYVETIRRLVDSYNEPLTRDNMRRLVREAASYAPYKQASQAFEFEYI